MTRHWWYLLIGRLPWQWMGRRVQPLALATTLSMATLVWALTAHLAVGDLLDVEPGHVLAVFSGLAVVMLTSGWWLRSQWLLVHGLLVSAAVWAGLASVLTIDIGWTVSTALAWCWFVGVAGAFLLEADGERRRDG